MNNNKVIPTFHFEKKLKRLLQKFPSLALELLELEKILLANPKSGTSLGKNIYKIRLASKSKGKGKSGGFRIITYVVEPVENGNVIYLITIYDKSEEATITKSEINDLIKNIFG